MTKSIDVHESLPLKDLVTLAESGTDVLLVDDGRAVARIVLVGKRVAGLHRGAIWTSDDFDEPLPDVFWTGNS